jgi:nitrate reductase NapE component
LKASRIISTAIGTIIVTIFIFPITVTMALFGAFHFILTTVKIYIKEELLPEEYDPGKEFGPGEYNLEELEHEEDLIKSESDR